VPAKNQNNRTNFGVAQNAERVADALTKHGPQTRGELAARLQISRKTVGTAVDRLNQRNSTKRRGEAVFGVPPDQAQLPQHVAEELDEHPGPTAEVLMLGSVAGSVVGIEIGHTHLSTSLGDANSRLLGDPGISESSHSIEKARPQATFDRVAEMVKLQLEECRIKPGEIRGVAISIPAPVSAEGRTLSASVLRPYDGVDIPKRLGESLQKIASLPTEIPVFAENDVDVMARGEQRYGKAFGLQNFAVIKCSGGVGSAIVADDRIVRGQNGGGAGEIGHCPIKPQVLVERDGHVWSGQDEEPLCRCGCWGHLEAYAGGRAIVDRIGALEAGKKKSIPARGSLSSQLDIAMQHALAKDGLHRKVIGDAAALLGVAANTLFHIFNPRLVLISGKLSEMGELFLDGVQKECNAQGTLFGNVTESIDLGTGTTTAERRRIGIRGAVTTALRKTQPRLRYE
jgi:glucokinase